MFLLLFHNFFCDIFSCLPINTASEMKKIEIQRTNIQNFMTVNEFYKSTENRSQIKWCVILQSCLSRKTPFGFSYMSLTNSQNSETHENGAADEKYSYKGRSPLTIFNTIARKVCDHTCTVENFLSSSKDRP